MSKRVQFIYVHVMTAVIFLVLVASVIGGTWFLMTAALDFLGW